jgi:hypothetical protein
MAGGGKEAVLVDEDVVRSSEIKALEKRSGERYPFRARIPWRTRFSGRPARWPMKKTDLALAGIARRGFAVKSVGDTLGVSRSQLHWRLREVSRSRGRYQKSEDAEMLFAFRTLIDDRPTYEHRQIWALLNRQREQGGKRWLNHKGIVTD